MAFTIDSIRNMLRINKHRLDDELEMQAAVQDDIAATCAKLDSRQMDLKKTLEATEAEVVEYLKATNDKMSNPVAVTEARRDGRYKSAWSAWLVAQQQHAEWDGLLSAWQSRGYALSTLANLYGMQYFSVRSAGSTTPDTSAPEESRRRLREASQNAAAARDTESPQPRRRSTS